MKISPKTRASAAVAANVCHFDANETGNFERALEHEQAEAVAALFPALRARSFIPIDTSVDPGADTFKWHYYEQIGLAKLIANYSTDLPDITFFAKENLSPIRSIGCSYKHSTTDMRRAAKMKIPPDSTKARLAREAIERVVDRTLAHGDTATGIPGFTNHPNVDVVDTGFTGDWLDPTTTAAAMLADLMLMAFHLRNATKQVHGVSGLRMILGTEGYSAIASKVFSEYTGETVLTTFLKAQKIVTEVESWEQLDLADDQGDGERIVVYEPLRENLRGVVPLDFEAHPAQPNGLNILIPCEGRIGGTVVERPLSMVYFDGLLDE